MATESKRSMFQASRPRLAVNDEFNRELGESTLRSLLVEESTQGLFRCEASFANQGPVPGRTADYRFFDRQLLDFGKAFSVAFGPPGEAGPVFAGRITGLEASYFGDRGPELLVLAEDRFQDLRMERRTRTFEDMTDADVFKAVVQDHGLTPRIDVDGPRHRILAQVNQSDLAFLRQRAAAIDAELWIDNRTFFAQARARRSSGRVAFTEGEGLLSFNVLADLAHQRTAVRVSGWDVANKRAIDVEVTESAIQAELEGRRSGSATLRSLAPRVERIALSAPQTEEEARATAEARYRSRARGFVRGYGVVEGTPRVRVGSTVELNNLGPMFDGPYYVTLARHTFDNECGYRTTFYVERPGIGG